MPEQGSNRGYKPCQLIQGLFAGVWCGANCFGQLDVVRHDNVLREMIGWKTGAGHRAYQRYFNKFSQAVNQRVFGRLYEWFFNQLVFDNYTLDFDSTVMVREGEQEGAVNTYAALLLNKYVCGLTWEQVTDKLGYKNVDYVKGELHSKALAAFEKEVMNTSQNLLVFPR